MFYLPESQTLQKRKTTVVICNVNQWTAGAYEQYTPANLFS